MGDRVLTGDTLLDPRHGAHRLPERRLTGPVSLHLRPPAAPARRNAGLPGTRLQGRHGQHDRRGKERATHRLQVRSADDYAELMANLNLSNPKMMQTSPCRPTCARAWRRRRIAARGWAGATARPTNGPGRPAAGGRTHRPARAHRARQARQHTVVRCTPPTPELQDNIRPGGMLFELAAATGKRMAVLLRVRRVSLGDGGAGGAGCGDQQRLPHPRWHRGVESGRREVGLNHRRHARLGVRDFTNTGASDRYRNQVAWSAVAEVHAETCFSYNGDPGERRLACTT